MDAAVLPMYAASAGSGEKSKPATPRRLEKLREQGNSWHSPEFQGAAALLVAFAGLKVYATYAGQHLMRFLSFDLQSVASPNISGLGMVARVLFHTFMLAALPFAIGLALVGVLMGVVQTGFRFSLRPLTPDLARINPAEGLQRMFSVNSMVDLGKGILKLLAVGAVVAVSIAGQLGKYPGLIGMSAGAALRTTTSMILAVAIRGAAAFMAVGALDVYIQYRRFQQNARMTEQEVRDEFKDTEGDPKMKGRRKDARRRMLGTGMRAVADATVLVTNPTHFAVALKWEESKAPAPFVVAKGSDELALAMRTMAYEHDVPVVENPPLARTLYRVPVSDPIPPDQYAAVAEIIAFLMRKRPLGGRAT